MALPSAFRYLTAIPFFLLYFKTIFADFNVSFASKNVDKGSNFEPIFALYGDAKLLGGGMSLQLSGSSVSSAGRVVYKYPIKLVEGNPTKPVSFETNFGFSLTSEQGDGLAFVMAPIGYPVNAFDGGSFGLLAGSKIKFLAVEFDTLRDKKYDDLNANHVGVDLTSLVSVKVSNVSSIKLTLNSGKKLQAWIAYEANSKSIEVRLSELGETKPLDPLLSYPIDLSRMWNETEVLFSLSSASGNSLQKCNLYSWNFKLWTVPHWMHSQPLDPTAFVEKRKELQLPQKRDCTFSLLGSLIFGIGCGALGALVVLFIWTVLGHRRPVVPENFEAQPLEFEYKKAKIVDKPSGKN